MEALRKSQAQLDEASLISFDSIKEALRDLFKQARFNKEIKNRVSMPELYYIDEKKLVFKYFDLD